VAVGTLVVAILLARADLHALGRSLAHARLGEVAIAFAVLLAALVANAFRWQVFLRPLGLALPAPALVRLTFVGTFFNAFLPTGFGGDAYKSFRLRGRASSMAPPLATAVLDRLAGLMGLAVLGLAGCAWRLGTGSTDRTTVAATGLALGVLLACGLALWLAPRWADPSGRASFTAVRRLRVFVDAFATAGREPQAIRWGTLLGIVSAVLLVAVNVVLGASLRISIPGPIWAGIVLIATVTTALPLSINGLGFREAAYVWCLAPFGVGHDRALAFALLVLAVTLASSAVGGVVYAVAGGGGGATAEAPG
jgi:uncharacterized membrane protein YbhN (UPF0104 family)